MDNDENRKNQLANTETTGVSNTENTDVANTESSDLQTRVEREYEFCRDMAFLGATIIVLVGIGGAISEDPRFYTTGIFGFGITSVFGVLGMLAARTESVERTNMQINTLWGLRTASVFCFVTTIITLVNALF